MPYTPATPSGDHVWHDPTMSARYTYFVSARCTDEALLTTTMVSNLILVDDTPPEVATPPVLLMALPLKAGAAGGRLVDHPIMSNACLNSSAWAGGSRPSQSLACLVECIGPGGKLKISMCAQ